MVAGYLPFDDDPTNPKGVANINQLYKYIVSAPLTFPEHVTPHPRDLLRRILVPNPRKRADLFEIARHSWLSDYHHVVELITSNNTITPVDIANPMVPSGGEQTTTSIIRSASVREPSKTQKAVLTTFGNLGGKETNLDQEEEPRPRPRRDIKRRLSRSSISRRRQTSFEA